MPLRDYLPLWLGGRDLVSTTDLMAVGSTVRPSIPIPAPPPAVPDEFGVSGTDNFGGYITREDFNPELDDFQQAVKIFDKMRRTDAQCHAMLQVIKLPLRSATWTCIPPEHGDPVDKKIADFCNECLFDDEAMQESWDFALRHILMMMDFGFSILEKVWRVDEEGYIRLKRLAPRLQRTIRQWHVQRNGQLRAIVQYAPVAHATERPGLGYGYGSGLGSNGGGMRLPFYQTTVGYEYLTIPADYAAVFVLEREGDNYEGWSALRTVYRNWWYKDQAYRIMGVGLDRWGVGIPTAELDGTSKLTSGELEELTNVLKGIRSNEKSYLVAPPGVKYKILPEGTRGGPPDGIAWIDHHDAQIARNVLAGFLTAATEARGSVHSSGLGTRLTDMFISSLNGVAKGIAGDLKTQIIRPLCNYNFDMTKRQLPHVICRDLEQVDMQNLVTVIGQLAGTVLTPDDDLESMLRKILRLPPLPANLTRKAQAQAQPGTQTAAMAPGLQAAAGTADPVAAPDAQAAPPDEPYEEAEGITHFSQDGPP